MFRIEVEFINWYNCSEFKIETTDSWRQAFGAFTIYVGNDDCKFCRVFIDGKETPILNYDAP